MSCGLALILSGTIPPPSRIPQCMFLLRIWCTESTNTSHPKHLENCVSAEGPHNPPGSAQALSQGCQAWGFKKGIQAGEEQEMQGNISRLYSIQNWIQKMHL